MRVTLFFSILFMMHPLFAQTDVRQLGELPEPVWETSGLVFYNGKVITHNDSGNLAQLFEIDTVTLSITRTVAITNAENVDWEDIAQDDNYFYIADFGNVEGQRQDLRVYRISKITYDTSDSVVAEEIAFVYEDQTDFANTGFSDWDAEAIFVLDDRLVILTKQWKSNNTIAYSIPKTPGNHSAQRLDEYAINGLVTGATYNQQSQMLYIIGYNSLFGAFINRVSGATGTAVFGGNKERLDSNIGFGQIEGITYTGENSYLVSSERFSNVGQGIDIPSVLYTFQTNDSQVSEPEPEPEPEPETGIEEPFILFRQFGSDELEYDLKTDKSVLGWAIFDTTGRRIRFMPADIQEIETIDISTLHPAIYYFSLYLAGETVSLPFAVD